MKVIGVYTIKGRGTVAVVDSVPRGVKIGCLLHCGDRAWTITGIEMISPSRRDGSMGFALRPADNLEGGPKENDILEL